MAGYKEPGFQDRVALAAKARDAALAKLKAKAPIDPAVVAERIAKAQEREAAQLARAAQKLEEKRLAAEAKAAAIEAEKEAAAEAARLAEPPAKAKKPKQTDEEKKAERDAKYLARKARKGRR
ncbi:MAG: DUF6481 family protein [Novosphingobium sp.]